MSALEKKAVKWRTPSGTETVLVDDVATQTAEPTPGDTTTAEPTPGDTTTAEPTPGDTTTAEPKDDNVNHPHRYTKGEVECISAIDSAVVGKPPDEVVCVANVIKYLWRYEEKEPVRSLLSARWYLDRLIDKVKRRTQQ